MSIVLVAAPRLRSLVTKCLMYVSEMLVLSHIQMLVMGAFSHNLFVGRSEFQTVLFNAGPRTECSATSFQVDSDNRIVKITVCVTVAFIHASG